MPETKTFDGSLRSFDAIVSWLGIEDADWIDRSNFVTMALTKQDGRKLFLMPGDTVSKADL